MQNISNLIQELAQSYGIPIWVILSVGAFVLIVFIATIFFIFKIFESSYKLYKKDMIQGVIWKWKWNGKDIIDLWCYCPTCKSMLIVDDENCQTTSNLGEKITFFVCDECGGCEKCRIKGGNRKYSLGVIKREILAKVRLKTYNIYAYKEF